MKNKQWLKQWMDQGAYTHEDILHIVGKGIAVEPESYTEKDILKIAGPPSCAENSRRPAGIRYP